MGQKKCPHCGGAGQVMVGADSYGLPKWRMCPMCNYTGYVEDFSYHPPGETKAGCALVLALAVGAIASIRALLG